jgi:hypothetical protein
MEYLAEIYLSDRGGTGFAELVARLRTAADELNEERLRVRCLRSIFVPADETCFVLFEAESKAAVEAAGGRAEVALVRTAEAVSGAWTSARADRGTPPSTTGTASAEGRAATPPPGGRAARSTGS